MAGTFEHVLDGTLRVGDPVMTKPRCHVSMDSAMHDPLRTLKRAGVVPRNVLREVRTGGGGGAYAGGGGSTAPSPSASTRRGPSRGGGTMGTGQRRSMTNTPTVRSTRQLDASPSFTLPSDGPTEEGLSTSAKFLQLVQRQGHTLVDPSDAPGPVLGVIESVTAKGYFVVDVWRRADVVPRVSEKRERATFMPSQLVKLTPQEFEATCRKPYMRDATHEQLLVSYGYDASAPVSLMAHNNRLIESLMERIDTSVHTKPDPTLRLRILQNRKAAPGAIKKAPPPRAVPVLDPLADVREELKALADFSSTSANAGGSPGRPGRTRTADPGSPGRSGSGGAALAGASTAELEQHHADQNALRDMTNVSVLMARPGSSQAHHGGFASLVAEEHDSFAFDVDGHATPTSTANPSSPGPPLPGFAPAHRRSESLGKNAVDTASAASSTPRESLLRGGASQAGVAGGPGNVSFASSALNHTTSNLEGALGAPYAAGGGGGTDVGAGARTIIEELALTQANSSASRTLKALLAARTNVAETTATMLGHLPTRYYPSSSSGSAGEAAPSGPVAGAPVRGLKRRGTATPTSTAGLAGSIRKASSSGHSGVPPGHIASNAIQGVIEGLADRDGRFIFRAKSPPELAGQAFLARLNRVELFVATPGQLSALADGKAAGMSDGDNDSDSIASRASVSQEGRPPGLPAPSSGKATSAVDEPSLFTTTSRVEPLDGAEALSRLRQQILTLVPVSPDETLTAIADVSLPTGDSLAEELLRCGFARAVFNAFDDASVIFPNDIAAKLGCLGGARTSVLKLKAAQERAQGLGIGMWSLPHAETNFQDVDGAVAAAAASATSAPKARTPQALTPVASRGVTPRAGGLRTTSGQASPVGLALDPSASHHRRQYSPAHPTASSSMPSLPGHQSDGADPIDYDEEVRPLFTDFETSAAFLAKVRGAATAEAR